MARYIDRDKLIKAVEDLQDCYNGFSDTYDKACIIGLIEEMPTADVPERNVGKWEVCNILDYAQRPTGRRVGRCPYCGHLTGEFRKIIESSKELTNFCPNCGADMRKETEDE